jgi:hypothetical protein
MLVCALLARLSGHTGDDRLRAAAAAGAAYTVAHQRPDGSWPYGELPHLDWVDNFHTGYVLECLWICRDTGEAGPALERGLDYYRDALFLEDGTPKYKPDSTYPVDSQCVAQAIQTFARTGLLEDAWRTFDFAQRRMRGRDGLFAFQRRRLWTNRTPHVRWTVAPMMLALAHLLEASELPR